MRRHLALVGDAALACGFAALGAWEALAQPDTPGPPAWTAPVAVLVALLLGVRRRYPRTVLVAVAAVGAAPHVVAGAEPAFYGFLLPFLVAAYTVATRTDRRGSLIVPAAGAAVLGALASRGHEFRTPNQTVIVVLAVGAAYAAGRITRLARVRGEQALDLLRREQDLRAREAIAAERERLARELHDAVAHEVSVMVIQAGAAGRLLDHDPAAARESLRAVERAGRHTIEELYLLLGLLREEELSEEPPGLARVPALVDRVRASGLAVDLSVLGQTPDVPAPVSLCAYRVIQESLTNVLKHTRDARAAVTVRHDAGTIHVQVRDDGGAGVPVADPRGSGSGLAGLAERVVALGGRFTAGPEAGRGFAVGATLPSAAA